MDKDAAPLKTGQGQIRMGNGGVVAPLFGVTFWNWFIFKKMGKFYGKSQIPHKVVFADWWYPGKEKFLLREKRPYPDIWQGSCGCNSDVTLRSEKGFVLEGFNLWR